MHNDYIERGWHVVPIPPKGKNPGFTGWQEFEISEDEDADDYFLGEKNIGVLLGPSGLIDIDLDCVEAVALAPEFLPPTATFGRKSSPRSHWIYECEGFYRKFIDPVTKECLLEIRAGAGLQTVFPGSVHASGEEIDWTDATPVSDADPVAAAGELAVAVWCKKHPGEAIPDRVLSWSQEPLEQGETAQGEQRPAPIVTFAGKDAELVEAIVLDCPSGGSRHDYRMCVAGHMFRAGIDEGAARKMLCEAMADARLGQDRTGAVMDAKKVITDTYHTARNTTGARTLIEEYEGRRTADRIEAVTTPDFEDIKKDPSEAWLQKLFDCALGSSLEPLEDAGIRNGLAKLALKRDSRLPIIWAKLKDAGYVHLKELKEATEMRMRELRDNLQPGNGLDAAHPDAKGMSLPAGYQIEEGRLRLGDELVINGQLELLAKCPGLDGVQARFAFKAPSSKTWVTSVAPYRSLVSAKDVLVLADHGCNVSSLESPAIVAFVRDYVCQNEKLLDRPIATRTGWHESGAFIWGRTVLGGPPELRAEYATDNQIGLSYANALHAEGEAAKSKHALRKAVETLPTAALCIAASLAACWIHKLSRPTLGVHLAGMGGKGKTRTLKIAGSVWGATGSAGGLSGQGTIAGANTTQRALEIAASCRSDLPFLLSDVRPFPGLTEVMHAVLNGDPRARATQRGGSTQGENYRAGAVISEGELNVLSLTTRQGFHRRMLELAPDSDMQSLWDLAGICSENYGHVGPEFAQGDPLPQDRLDYWQAQTKRLFGHDASVNAASLLATAEHAAPLLGASSLQWCQNVLQALQADAYERAADGPSQAERVEDDLSEVLVEMAPQIADNQEATRLNESPRPWVGYRDENTIIVRASVLQEMLKKRGHDAIKDALKALESIGAIESTVKTQHMVSGVRVRCYHITQRLDLDCLG